MPHTKHGLERAADAMRLRAKTVLTDRKRRPFVIAVVVSGALLLSVLSWLLLWPAEIEVLEIETIPTELALSVVARARPENLVDVRSQNSGEIVRLLRDDGDVVVTGQPLAVVRSTVEQAQTEAGSARVAAGRAEANRARLAFNRTRTLAERGVASAAALDEARAGLQAAEAGLSAAAGDRRAASARTGEFTIRAPMAGLILVRTVDNGQVISPQMTLFQIGSSQGLELQADVDEAFADALRAGMTARAALSGSDVIFPARITEVSPRIDPTTGGRLIKLKPLEPIAIAPGRSVDVTIIVARRAAGITVPRQAVIDATTDPTVYVVDHSGVVRIRPIVIADWPSLDAIVDAGLDSGDRVVLVPADVRSGRRVRVRLQTPAAATGD